MNTNIFLQKNKYQHQAVTINGLLSRCLLLLTGLFIFLQGNSQTDKRVAMADKYFSSGDYYTAAGLYGQFLQASGKSKYHSDFPLNVKRGTGSAGNYKSKTDVLFKQAESYRLANYWVEASDLYQRCSNKDSVKYAVALYLRAVCLRNLGDYAGAEESLDRFFHNYTATDDWSNAAIKEKQTIQFARAQTSRPDSVMYHVQKIKTAFGDKGVFAPVALNRNQFLVTSTQTDAVSQGANPYHNRLFRSALSDNDVQDNEPLLIESIDSSFNQGAACVSPDNNHLYITQWKKENGLTVSSIYYSNKTTTGWSKPQLLLSVNEAGHNSKQPFCSVDGKYLFFASDRNGGQGGFDIWYAPLLSDGTTGDAVNAGAVNSPANEQAPFYHNTTNTIVFSSDRAPGMGGYDLFSAKGSVTDWKAPENMGAPVNSPRDDIYFFAKENGPLLDNSIISSDRGSECCLGIYSVSKMAKSKSVMGVVMDCAVNEPLDSARVTLKDASGKTWQMITAADGKYRFDISEDTKQQQLVVRKDNYNEKTADVSVDKVDGTNWRTDTLHNATFCLEKKFVLKVENVVTVYFDFAMSDLKVRTTAQLDSIYNVMVENPTYRVQISGYTDSKGTVEYNNKLSEKRAKACSDYLVQKGLLPARISIHSFGAMFPVEMELINGRDNAEGRSKNRRALINIDKE